MLLDACKLLLRLLFSDGFYRFVERCDKGGRWFAASGLLAAMQLDRGGFNSVDWDRFLQVS